MEKPNLFKHARSELAQDAVLAYILEWAKPELRDVNPKMNKLGYLLLTEMTSKSISKEINVKKLTINTQHNHIDVEIIINGEIAMFIEDKIDGKLRSEQIQDYKSGLKEKYKYVYAIYAKTGNESCVNKPKEDIDGFLYRTDILDILGKYDGNNSIITNYREHLQAIENETQSFIHIPYNEWSPLAIEGYYMMLEQIIGLCDLPSMEYPSMWEYVANQKGGYRLLWWNYRDITINDAKCKIYLQIEDAKKLTVRIGYCTLAGEKDVRTTTGWMQTVLRWLQEYSKDFPELQIKKVGRFRAGNTSSVAIISKPSNENNHLTYMSTYEDGRLNIRKTQQMLTAAGKLIDTLSKKYYI